MLHAQGLERVDLLKIDVERAELDVLRGVRREDWPRIRQVVLEVHDVHGQLARVQRLLQVTAGFRHCVTEQDAQLAGSTLYNVYCWR